MCRAIVALRLHHARCCCYGWFVIHFADNLGASPASTLYICYTIAAAGAMFLWQCFSSTNQVMRRCVTPPSQQARGRAVASLRHVGPRPVSFTAPAGASPLLALHSPRAPAPLRAPPIVEFLAAHDALLADSVKPRHPWLLQPVRRSAHQRMTPRSASSPRNPSATQRRTSLPPQRTHTLLTAHPIAAQKLSW